MTISIMCLDLALKHARLSFICIFNGSQIYLLPWETLKHLLKRAELRCIGLCYRRLRPLKSVKDILESVCFDYFHSEM